MDGFEIMKCSGLPARLKNGAEIRIGDARNWVRVVASGWDENDTPVFRLQFWDGTTGKRLWTVAELDKEGAELI